MRYEALRSNEKLWDMYSAKHDYPRADSTLGLEESNPILTPLASECLISQGAIEYPEKRNFAICFTHDVDEIYMPMSHFLQSTYHYARRMDITGVKDSLMWKLRKSKCPYLDFRKILDIEKDHGVKSTFFFLATKEDALRSRYSIEDTAEILREIEADGFEVGLHGGFYAYRDLGEITEQKARLERYTHQRVRGYRNHYLNFSVPMTWRYLKKAGFLYDSTFGYNLYNGFRNGMSHPYKPYDRIRGEFIDLIEIPPIIMDSAFRRGPPSTSWEELLRIVKMVEKTHGVLTVNFHNEAFHAPYKAGFLSLYTRLLEEGVKRHAWLTNATEIYSWWRDNCIE